MFNRLVPAAHTSALVAGVSHVTSITIITKSMGIEGIGIVALTYILTFAAAIPFGIVLLAVVVLFRIGLIASFALFLVAAPVAVIAVSTLLFGFDPKTIPLEYAFMAFPSVIAAWYFSVYHEWKKQHNNANT